MMEKKTKEQASVQNFYPNRSYFIQKFVCALIDSYISFHAALGMRDFLKEFCPIGGCLPKTNPSPLYQHLPYYLQ